jgi:hypothetical protein
MKIPTRDATVVVIGAGFSIPADQPSTQRILRIASEQRNPELPGMVRVLEEFMRKWTAPNSPLKSPALQERLAAYLPLAEADIEDLLLALLSVVAFNPPVFPNSLSRPHNLRGWVESQLHYELQLAYWTLLLIYFGVVSNPYEPSPLDYGQHDSLEWDAEMPEVYRRFCAALPRRTFVLSTNYDDILERALLGARRSWAYAGLTYFAPWMMDNAYRPAAGTYYMCSPDFCSSAGGGDLTWARADWRPPASEPGAEITLCRLHGSFRWLQCRNCSRVYSVDWYAAHPVGTFMGIGDEFEWDYAFRCWDADCIWAPLQCILLPGQKRRLSRAAKSMPARQRLRYPIYPMNNSVIESHWQTAQVAASKCCRLIIIGSALRESDIEFVSCVRRAGARASQVLVVNPSERDVKRADEVCAKPVRSFRSLEELLANGVLADSVDS